jgi:hypothetical protein
MREDLETLMTAADEGRRSAQERPCSRIGRFEETRVLGSHGGRVA